MNFKTGDRFVRIGADNVWSSEDNRFNKGVVVADPKPNERGWSGCECDSDSCLSVPVRFDGYTEYELHRYPNNCHNIASCAIDLELDEEEIEAVIASIKSAIH